MSPTDTPYVVIIHQCSSHCNSSHSPYYYYYYNTSIFLLFLYQLEERVTYLVREVEFNKKERKFSVEIATGPSSDN